MLPNIMRSIMMNYCRARGLFCTPNASKRCAHRAWINGERTQTVGCCQTNKSGLASFNYYLLDMKRSTDDGNDSIMVDQFEWPVGTILAMADTDSILPRVFVMISDWLAECSILNILVGIDSH
jgi:hypothetical protein